MIAETETNDYFWTLTIRKSVVMRNLSTLALSLTMLLSCGLSTMQAQMMPDSTVQICAYWTPGEKYSYLNVVEQFDVDGQGDTTLTQRRSEEMTFEVMSQTKDHYNVRLTYGDYSSMDENEQRAHEAVLEAVGPYVVEFVTSNTGTFIEVTNLEALVAQYKASLQPTIDVMWESLGAEQRKAMSKKQLQQLVETSIANPSAIIAAMVEDFARLFFYHGVRLEIGQQYEIEESFMLPIGKQQPVRDTTFFWVDDRLTDEYSVVCNNYASIDVKESVASALSDTIAAMDTENQLPPSVHDSLATAMSRVQIRMEQLSSEEIHLESGWPIQFYFERTVNVILGDDAPKPASILRRRVDLITEE